MNEEVINLVKIWKEKVKEQQKENIWYIVRNNTKHINAHTNETCPQ